MSTIIPKKQNADLLIKLEFGEVRNTNKNATTVILSIAENLASSGSNRKGDSSVALLTQNDTDWVCARQTSII